MVKSECTAVVIVTLRVVLGHHGIMPSVAYRFSIPKGAFVFPFRSITICLFCKELLS